MNIFIDHVGDGHKHYRMAITLMLYNECLWGRRVTKKGNVAQVEFYNNRYLMESEKTLLLFPDYESPRSEDDGERPGKYLINV